VRTSFEATEIILMNAEIILKRFNNNPLEDSDASSLQSEGDGSNWRYMCESGTASGNGGSRSGKWRLSKREMDACVASRRFHLACALMLSHKTTPLSRAYSLPYIFSQPRWPLPPNWSLGLVRDLFSCPLAIMPSLHYSVLRLTLLFYRPTMRPLRCNRQKNSSTHNLAKSSAIFAIVTQ
jgi:hypothetical protein